MTPLGVANWKLLLVSPGLLLFSVADFQQYLSIEINHNFEYNSFSGSCLSCESLNLRVIWGTPNTLPYRAMMLMIMLNPYYA